MDNSFQTSFIPKKSLAQGGTTKEPKSLLSMIGLFLLIATLLAAGGMYLYKNYLIQQEDVLSSSLSKTRDTFEKDTLEELELFNKRSEVASKILANHTVLSPFFSRIAEITIPSVQYKTFDYQTGTNSHMVNIKGLAKDYRSIAQQADAFNTTKGRSFKNVLFSDLTRDKDNYVTFSLSFEIEPELLSYEKNLIIPSLGSSSSGLTSTEIEINNNSPISPGINESALPGITEENTL
jgi:hypothetical protein